MAGGASQSGAGRLDRLRSWRQHHGTSAADSLRRLLKSPLTSLMIWSTIGIAMALPLGLALALDNARAVSGDWDGSARFSLFLRAGMSLEAAERLRRGLDAREDIAATRLVPRREALREFRQLSGFDDVLSDPDDNPLPHLILATPTRETDADAAAALKRRFEDLPEVDRAVLDTVWLQRLDALMQLGRRLVLVLTAVLALGVLLVVGNTIRLAVESRRDEIVVIKLVGGSDAFVRRPFLYTGLWYGLGGAALSWLTVSLALWGLREPLSTLALLYQSDFRPHGLSLEGGARLLLLGALLGLLGARLAVGRHLSAIKPR